MLFRNPYSNFRYLMETEDKTKEGKTKGLHMRILKTGILHKSIITMPRAAVWHVGAYFCDLAVLRVFEFQFGLAQHPLDQ